MKTLRQYIRVILLEESENWPKNCPKFGVESAVAKKDLLTEPDEVEEREDAATDEFSGAGAVAGYTLPLGASNHPTSLKQRGEIAGSAFGGAKPAKKKKKKRSKTK